MKDKKTKNEDGGKKATKHSMTIDVAFGLPDEDSNRIAAKLYENIMNRVAVDVAKEVKDFILAMLIALELRGAGKRGAE